jgi:multiple sugar transport system permease protein
VMTYGGPGTASTTLPFLSYRLSFINYKYALGAGVATFTIVIVFALALVYVRATRQMEKT